MPSSQYPTLLGAAASGEGAELIPTLQRRKLGPDRSPALIRFASSIGRESSLAQQIL